MVAASRDAPRGFLRRLSPTTATQNKWSQANHGDLNSLAKVLLLNVRIHPRRTPLPQTDGFRWRRFSKPDILTPLLNPFTQLS